MSSPNYKKAQEELYKILKSIRLSNPTIDSIGALIDLREIISKAILDDLDTLRKNK